MVVVTLTGDRVLQCILMKVGIRSIQLDCNCRNPIVLDRSQIVRIRGFSLAETDAMLIQQARTPGLNLEGQTHRSSGLSTGSIVLIVLGVTAAVAFVGLVAALAVGFRDFEVPTLGGSYSRVLMRSHGVSLRGAG